MKRFNILLRNDKRKQYERIALLIIILNLAIFIYLLFASDNKAVKNTLTWSSILVIIAIAVDFFLRSMKKYEDSAYKAAAEFVITLAWFQLGYWWIAGLCFVLGLLYLAAKRPLLVIVEKDKISYPAFFNKRIAWSELNSLLIKDGLLTIDFRNNHLIQQFVDPVKTTLNEQEFNDFCRQQLNQ